MLAEEEEGSREDRDALPLVVSWEEDRRKDNRKRRPAISIERVNWESERECERTVLWIVDASRQCAGDARPQVKAAAVLKVIEPVCRRLLLRGR